MGLSVDLCSSAQTSRLSPNRNRYPSAKPQNLCLKRVKKDQSSCISCHFQSMCTSDTLVDVPKRNYELKPVLNKLYVYFNFVPMSGSVKLCYIPISLIEAGLSSVSVSDVLSCSMLKSRTSLVSSSMVLILSGSSIDSISDLASSLLLLPLLTEAG